MKSATEEKLAHLSDVQLNELIERYYNGSDTVADLIEEYQINVRTSGLVRLFPPIVHDNLSCPYCPQENLVSNRKSRTGATWSQKKCYCPKCGHTEDAYCSCDNCSQLRQLHEQKCEDDKRTIISENFPYPDISYPNIEDLSFKDALYISTIVRHLVTEDLDTVYPYEENNPPLAPTFEFTNEIVMHLRSKGFLAIRHSSPIDAFVFNDDFTDTSAYYPTRINWDFLPCMTSNQKASYIKELTNFVRDEKWPDDWNDDVDKEWNKIAKYECFEYIRYALQERSFNLDKFGEKSHTVIETLLQSFPVSKVINLSWQTAKEITDLSVRKGIPKYRAKNVFIGSLERRAERCLADKWSIKDSHRDYNLPRTVVSSTLFDVFLELGDEAFTAIPPKLN
ncbi:MAG: hypothetical protein GY927_25330 [bacterium]|nr:hypothetical protein [bacterium]